MTAGGAAIEPAALGRDAGLLEAWLCERAVGYGNRPALESASLPVASSLSFKRLEEDSARLSAGMQGLGLRRGDAIAIWLPNRPVWMLVHFAAARLGLLTIPLNTWYRESEVAHFMGLAGCRALFVDRSFRGIDFTSILTGALQTIGSRGHLEWLVDVGPEDAASLPAALRRVPFADLLAMASARDLGRCGGNERMIAYSTSGTTGLSKLAVHREGALLSHAAAVADKAGMTKDDVVLGALPPCGAYGYTLLLAAMTAGARSIVIDEFDLDRVVALIAAERVTMLALTEPIMRRLLDHPQASPQAFASLRLVFSAGGTLQDVVERAEREFGFRLTNVYGSSEVLALAAFWDEGRDASARSAAGGLLTSAGMKVRCVDADGASLPVGKEGELQFSGPIVTGGYLANEEANRKAFTADGWFRSGDLGSVADEQGSAFHYMARMNDALRIKGFLVAPGEIEQMLQQHPAVLAAQVVGIPDGLGEELAAAFVVVREGMQVSTDELRRFCRERMASYKTPALLEIIDGFPVTRSANGDKVMKNKLREMAKARHMG